MDGGWTNQRPASPLPYPRRLEALRASSSAASSDYSAGALSRKLRGWFLPSHPGVQQRQSEDKYWQHEIGIERERPNALTNCWREPEVSKGQPHGRDPRPHQQNAADRSGNADCRQDGLAGILAPKQRQDRWRQQYLIVGSEHRDDHDC